MEMFSHSVIPMVLRRMRQPMLLVITVYSIAILGFVLIPGTTPEGEPWRMDFLHATYFVSYMATTIGFGEIPYAFNGMQRLWGLFAIYATVISWIYALGAVIGLIQEPAFKHVMVRNRFRREVRAMREPFYLVCGYGDTGSALVGALVERGRRVVVLDFSADKINDLLVAELPAHAPSLVADASLPNNLSIAGITHPQCAAVLAVTDRDHTNLQIAISAKLLNPDLITICRAESHDTAANMASFGTDHIVNPFDSFADNLTMAMRSEDLHILHQWLGGGEHNEVFSQRQPPRGHWVICGYGRLGRAVHRYLRYQGLPATIVDLHAYELDDDFPRVQGKGTEAVTLREAGIESAAAIIAATRDDADNLSIIMTARELNPDLYTAARQNHSVNRDIFRAARLDMLMTPSQIIAGRMMAILSSRLLLDFLPSARHQRREWVSQLVTELRRRCHGRTPRVWAQTIDPARAPALINVMDQGRQVRITELIKAPAHRSEPAAMALMLIRGEEKLICPEESTALQPGDRVLFAGTKGGEGRQRWACENENFLHFLLTGEQRPQGYLWRWLARRRDLRQG